MYLQKPVTVLEKHIREFLEYLEIERGRSARTIRNYDFYLQRFAAWAQVQRPEKITRDLIRRYLLSLNRAPMGREETTIKKSTQNYHLIALRTFLKYLARQEV